MTFKNEENRIFLEDESGHMIAEVTFPKISDNVVDINHTYVDDSLRGQGVASKLLEELCLKLIKENKKAYPTCSYAIQWFEKNPEYSHLLAD